MTKDSIDDSLLDEAIRSVRDGNAAAFEPIVRRFERPLRAWLAIQAPPGVDVDEIAQRSFIAAFTRIADFEPGTSFSAWLFTIALFQLRTETNAFEESQISTPVTGRTCYNESWIVEDRNRPKCGQPGWIIYGHVWKHWESMSAVLLFGDMTRVSLWKKWRLAVGARSLRSKSNFG